MDYFTEMKIGQLARTKLCDYFLDEKRVTAEEIEQMLDIEMSNLLFGLNFPALI